MNIDRFVDKVLELTYSVGFLTMFVILLYMGIGLILAFPLMWLWNYTLPELTNGLLANIKYWQAWSLIVICSILFGGSGPKD